MNYAVIIFITVFGLILFKSQTNSFVDNGVEIALTKVRVHEEGYAAISRTILLEDSQRDEVLKLLAESVDEEEGEFKPEYLLQLISEKGKVCKILFDPVGKFQYLHQKGVKKVDIGSLEFNL